MVSVTKSIAPWPAGPGEDRRVRIHEWRISHCGDRKVYRVQGTHVWISPVTQWKHWGAALAGHSNDGEYTVVVQY